MAPKRIDCPVYVVIRSTGEYSDRYETVLGYFTDEVDAQAFCAGAEREWKEAAALFPLPDYPSIEWGDDDFKTVYPQRVLLSVSDEIGTVRICTPDYSGGQRVPRSDEEKAHRRAAKAEYAAKRRSANECRLSHVTFDPDGSEEASWYYEKAEALPAPPDA